MSAIRPRTRRAFSEADLVRLKALYDDRSVPLLDVARAFDVPVSTLLRWVAEMDWPRRSARGAVRPAATFLVSRLAGDEAEPTAPGPAREPPRLVATLRQVSKLARRELVDLAATPARSLKERERAARLVASLTRSLERVGKALEAERDKAIARRIDRRARARWAAEREDQFTG